MTKTKLDPYYRYQHEKQFIKNAEIKKRKEQKREEERLKQINEEAIHATQPDTTSELDDLIMDAKVSGDYDLASDLLDRKAELEAKQEAERLWIKSGIDPEQYALEMLKKLKQKHPEEFQK